MPPKRSPVRRRGRKRSLKKLFLLVTEGDVTEPDYFYILNDILNAHSARAVIKVPKTRSERDPERLFKRLVSHYEEYRRDVSGRNLEAWLVVDMDENKPERLREVAEKLKERGMGLALSNPRFETWLLAHFTERSLGNPDGELKKHLLGYDKSLKGYEKHFSLQAIKDAAQLAMGRLRRVVPERMPPCEDMTWWPESPGHTTVACLVARILKDAGLEDSSSD